MNATSLTPLPSTDTTQPRHTVDRLSPVSASLNQPPASGQARPRMYGKPARTNRSQKEQKNRIKGKYANRGESLVIKTRDKAKERAAQGSNDPGVIVVRARPQITADALHNNDNFMDFFVNNLSRGWDALNKATSFLPVAFSQSIDANLQPETKPTTATSRTASVSTNLHDLDHSSLPSPKCTSSTAISEVSAYKPEPSLAKNIEETEKEKSSVVSRKIIHVTTNEIQAMKKLQHCLDRVRKKIPYVANQWNGGVLPSNGDAWVRGVWHSSVYSRKWQPIVNEKISLVEALLNLDLILEEENRKLIKTKEPTSSMNSEHSVVDPQSPQASALDRTIEERNNIRKEIETRDALTLSQVKEIAEETYKIGGACCEGIAAVTFVELCIEPALADFLVQWEIWINSKGESHNFAVIYDEKERPFIVADAWTNTFRAYRYSEISRKFIGHSIIARRNPKKDEERKAFSQDDRENFDDIEMLPYDEVNRLISQHLIKNLQRPQFGPKSRLFPPPGSELVKKISSLQMIRQYDRYTFLDRGTIYEDPVTGETHDPVGSLPPGVAIGGQSPVYEEEISKRTQ